jgi:hypothetical protein
LIDAGKVKHLGLSEAGAKLIGSMLHGPQKSKFPKMRISEGASLGASSCEERRLIAMLATSK